MALTPGTRLGPYEIVAPLGAGGMGEVYRAKDTDLKREVAIKVLPSGVVGDPERLGRFRREAEILAALNHTHIAQIYGIANSADGGPALVMELVEGPTLAEVLAKGPVEPARSLDIAVRIAEGLEAAHDAGVVHRDLKPANIKVRGDGVVKLLDFGLARSLAGGASEGATESPTVMSPAVTHPGVVLGTAAYMSPEHARGQVADVRSDIWAFGCVQFETLSGRRAFTGTTIADVVAAVLDREPDWTTLPASAGADLERVLRRCLAKDRRQRYAAIADVRLDLLEVRAGDAVTGAGAPTPRRGAAMAIAALTGAALATAINFAVRPAAVAPSPDPLTAATVIADEGRITFGHGEVAFDLSGRSVAVEITGSDGRGRIWIRPLDGRAGTPVAGTEGGRSPAFSPDGKWLAFTADGKLLKVPAEGGSPTVLADAPHLHGVSWSTDSRFVYYAPALTSGIHRVAVDGGQAEQVTSVDTAAGQVTHEWPVMSPDGMLCYVVNAQARTFEDSHIMALRPDSRESSVLVRNAIAPRFDDRGRLFYLNRNGAIAVASLDEAGRIGGEPRVLAAHALSASGNGVFDVGRSGAIAYVKALDAGRRQVVAVTLDGHVQELSDERPFQVLAVAPDGAKMAASVIGGSLLAAEVARPVWTLVPVNTRTAPLLLWSQDSTRIVFSPSLGTIASVTPSGVAGPTIVEEANAALSPYAWNGRTGALLFRKLSSGGIWTQKVGVVDGGEPLPVFDQRISASHVAVEPRRNLVAYATDFSGRYDVYIRALDEAEPTIRVSSDATAMEPHWAADGTRLYFAAGRGVQVVDVSTAPLKVSPARGVPAVVNTLFPGGNNQTFAVLPDDRIVYIREGDTEPRNRLLVLQDWRSLLPAASWATQPR